MPIMYIPGYNTYLRHCKNFNEVFAKIEINTYKIVYGIVNFTFHVNS